MTNKNIVECSGRHSPDRHLFKRGSAGAGGAGGGPKHPGEGRCAGQGVGPAVAAASSGMEEGVHRAWVKDKAGVARNQVEL